jgi:hypothetical protein
LAGSEEQAGDGGEEVDVVLEDGDETGLALGGQRCGGKEARVGGGVWVGDGVGESDSAILLTKDFDCNTLQTKYSGTLEVRLAQHYSTQVKQRNGQRLFEPPSIEGYLHRIRRNSQIKAALVYLATYDGQLFTVRSSDAEPPAPPTSLIALAGKAGHTSAGFRKRERERETRQIQNAIMFCDLRDILAVRRAFHMVVRTEGVGMGRDASLSRDLSMIHEESRSRVGADSAGHEGRMNRNGLAASASAGAGTLQVEGMYREVDAQILWPRIETTDSDEEDEGGDEGLAKVQDKGKMRMRRSFEVVYKSGYVMRFEVHEVISSANS